MKQRSIISFLILAISMVSGAGYLGYRSSQAGAQATPEAPRTIPVSTCDVQQSVTAPGSLVNTSQVTLEMPADGKLAEILAQPGDRVKVGQPLARLAGEEQFTAAVTSARLELATAQQELEELHANADLEAAQALQAVATAQKTVNSARQYLVNLKSEAPQADVDAAKAAVILAKIQLDRARKEFKPFEKKSEENPVRAMLLSHLAEAQKQYDARVARLNNLLGSASESELALAEADLAVAEAEFADAQRRYERLRDGLDPHRVELATAKVDHARAQLAMAETALANIELGAPMNGVVLEVMVRPGESLAAGTAVMVMSDPQAVEVEASVIEEDLPYVQAGQTVQVFFDALPDAEVDGKVTRILPKRLPGDRPLYSVYISLDHVPTELVEGMTADASITIDQRENVLCLPRSIVRAASDGTALLEVWVDGQIEERMVRVGLRGDVNVEIISGLHKGEQVVAK